MPNDMSNWLEDTLPAPPEGWTPESWAVGHIARLWELRTNLAHRPAAQKGKRAGKSQIARWDASLKYAVESWARLTGQDPSQGIESAGSKVDLSIETPALAVAYRQEILEEGSKAVTWASRLGHRRTVNKMVFYLDREVQDIDRIFL